MSGNPNPKMSVGGNIQRQMLNMSYGTTHDASGTTMRNQLVTDKRTGAYTHLGQFKWVCTTPTASLDAMTVVTTIPNAQ